MFLDTIWKHLTFLIKVKKIVLALFKVVIKSLERFYNLRF